MSTSGVPAFALPLRVLPPIKVGRGRARLLVERNVVAYRRGWIFLVSGFFEPLFYLLSIGLGLNHLVGHLPIDGRSIPYTDYVAPGLLASSAMNGAIFDATFGIFFKLKIAKTYDAVLATPLGVRDVAIGELSWSLIRGTAYSIAFLVVMAALGLIASWWAVLCLPAAMLVSFAFGGAGMFGTCYMRSWQDFDLVSLAIVPLFLFSGVFYPLSLYPGWLRIVVTLTPLYQGVALLRGLDSGVLGPVLLVHACYLGSARRGRPGRRVPPAGASAASVRDLPNGPPEQAGRARAVARGQSWHGPAHRRGSKGSRCWCAQSAPVAGLWSGWMSRPMGTIATTSAPPRAERDRGALGAGAGGVGVVEHQHSPAGHGADQAEAPPGGVKMPERLGTLRDHRCQRQPGLSHEGRGDEADERVLAAPGGRVARSWTAQARRAWRRRPRGSVRRGNGGGGPGTRRGASTGRLVAHRALDVTARPCSRLGARAAASPERTARSERSV